MNFSDEEDYIMRKIKELVKVLFSVMFGKQYVSVELPDENKCEVSGDALRTYEEMVDQGSINEAENMLLEKLNPSNKEEIYAAILFYQYIGDKEEGFLQAHGYSKEEALEGVKIIAEKAGYGQLLDFLK